MSVFIDREAVIGIVGLGYVGLPLAVAFGVEYRTIGLDIDEQRISELNDNIDRTLEVEQPDLVAADNLSYTSVVDDIAACNIYIVTVPTPVTAHKQPNLQPLHSASRMIGSVLKEGDIVIYESTVYPGATEEECVPILERESGLKFNTGFTVGYSPERINPGDKLHRLQNIKKVTAGSTTDTGQIVDRLYASIIDAGTHLASSIKVAEAAKVIENTQRDVNIALVNELALIFNKLDIDTQEVLHAAGTKWNFLPFTPGLVGGHCIGVDPYYLTHKADEIGYHSRVILAGREINDGMGQHVAEQVIKLMTMNRIHVVGSRILVLGFAFKENCPDLRNTRVIDIVDTLGEYNAEVDVYDPWIDANQAAAEYQASFVTTLADNEYDAVILAVAHQEFLDDGMSRINATSKTPRIVYDVKSVLPIESVDGRL
ncbi:Vi polysaccharide biosynthesis protein VipA/TviB [Chromatiales bacterium (ex Bugula neritina AB1)]|nr:Vi polysaccharide biosynthesis protein VipA/TviB [Chromatiales bacterium (ex Bugula neritina AB1)]